MSRPLKYKKAASLLIERLNMIGSYL